MGTALPVGGGVRGAVALAEAPEGVTEAVPPPPPPRPAPAPLLPLAGGEGVAEAEAVTVGQVEREGEAEAPPCALPRLGEGRVVALALRVPSTPVALAVAQAEAADVALGALEALPVREAPGEAEGEPEKEGEGEGDSVALSLGAGVPVDSSRAVGVEGALALAARLPPLGTAEGDRAPLAPAVAVDVAGKV